MLKGRLVLYKWRKLYNLEKYKQEENKQKTENYPITRIKVQCTGFKLPISGTMRGQKLIQTNL